MTNSGSLRGGRHPSNRRLPPIISLPSATRGSILLQSFRTIAAQGFQNSCPKLWGPKKIRKFREKFTKKIQGGAHHDQFWKLSSNQRPASLDTEIAP